MNRELIEQDIISELAKKDKPVPGWQTLRRMVDKRIEKAREERG